MSAASCKQHSSPAASCTQHPPEGSSSFTAAPPRQANNPSLIIADYAIPCCGAGSGFLVAESAPRVSANIGGAGRRGSGHRQDSGLQPALIESLPSPYGGGAGRVRPGERPSDDSDSDTLDLCGRTEAQVKKTVQYIKERQERCYGKTTPSKPELPKEDPWMHNDPWSTVVSAYWADLSAARGRK